MVGTGSVPAMKLTELAESEGQRPHPSKQGRQWTDEEKARMSAKCSGRVVSQETKDKIKATYAAKRAAREALALATTPTAPQVPSRVAQGGTASWNVSGSRPRRGQPCWPNRWPLRGCRWRWPTERWTGLSTP